MILFKFEDLLKPPGFRGYPGMEPAFRVIPRKFFGFRLIYGPWCPSKTEAFREWAKNVWEHYFGI